MCCKIEALYSYLCPPPRQVHLRQRTAFSPVASAGGRGTLQSEMRPPFSSFIASVMLLLLFRLEHISALTFLSNRFFYVVPRDEGPLFLLLRKKDYLLFGPSSIPVELGSPSCDMLLSWTAHYVLCGDRGSTSRLNVLMDRLFPLLSWFCA